MKEIKFVQDPATKVWWYISAKKEKKPGRPLWVGKFSSKEAAIAAARKAGEIK